MIQMLAGEIGPRRPCSDAEKDAANRLAAWLHDRGVEARIEEFEGYSTFAAPYAALFTASLAGGLLQRSRRRGVRRLGDGLALSAVVTAALEGDLRWTPLSDRLARRPSVNVLGHVPSAGPTRRRVCLCGHLDTTRSGLMFHPRLARHLAALLQVPAASALALAAGPALRRFRGGRTIHAAALAGIVFALAMLLERELRGRGRARGERQRLGNGGRAAAGGRVRGGAARPHRGRRPDHELRGVRPARCAGVRAPPHGCAPRRPRS